MQRVLPRVEVVFAHGEQDVRVPASGVLRGIAWPSGVVMATVYVTRSTNGVAAASSTLRWPVRVENGQISESLMLRFSRNAVLAAFPVGRAQALLVIECKGKMVATAPLTLGVLQH